MIKAELLRHHASRVQVYGIFNRLDNGLELLQYSNKVKQEVCFFKSKVKFL